MVHNLILDGGEFTLKHNPYLTMPLTIQGRPNRSTAKGQRYFRWLKLMNEVSVIYYGYGAVFTPMEFIDYKEIND